MPTRTREPCQPTRHQGGSSCFHRGSSPGGKTNRVLPVSTFVFFEDHRVLPYRAPMHPFPFLLSFFTFALPPNCPLFKTANNSSARRFFIIYRPWIGLHTYMYDVHRFSRLSPLFYIVSIFRRGGEANENSIGGDRNFARFRNFPLKDEKRRRENFPCERLNFTV